MVWVVAGGVEDGDADQAAGVDWRDIIALAVADTYLIVTCWDHGVLYMALGGPVPFGCHISPTNFIVGGDRG